MRRWAIPARTLAGLLLAAIVLGGLGAVGAMLTTFRRGARARVDMAEVAAVQPACPEDGWVRRPSHGVEAPREERLEAGRRLVVRATEVLGAEWKVANWNGAPYFVTTRRMPDEIAGPWAATVAGATDERLPEPPEAVRAWTDERGPELRLLAAEIAAGPTPEWEQDLRWDVTREARLADVLARHFEMLAAVHAQRDEHGDAEALLEAAWTLRAGIARLLPAHLGDDVLLGALRCTRVADEAEWLLRLDSVDVRAEEAGEILHLTAQHVQRTGTDPEDVPPWVPAALLAVLSVPGELEAAHDSEIATESVSRLRALGPCDEPVDALPGSWARDRGLARWLPPSSGLRVAHRLVAAAEREVPLRLTQAVLRVRAGLPPGDPCGAITASRGADGRTTLTWESAPHPLAADHGVPAPRAFTLDAPP